MRNVKYIVLHCTATPQNTTISSIQNYWRKVLGWRNPGYHFIIKADGEAVQLLPINEVANGVKGYNSESIHISYIGGVDPSGKPRDTRTVQQEATTLALLHDLKKKYPNAQIKGHRDFPGVNKACPSFEVATWLKKVGLFIALVFMIGCGGTKEVGSTRTITTKEKDSVFRTLEVVDTMMVVREADMAEITKSIKELTDKPVSFKSGAATATLKKVGDEIHATCECDELRQAVKLYKETIERQKTIITDQQDTITLLKKEMPGWAKPFLYLGIAVTIGIFGLAVLYIIKR